MSKFKTGDIVYGYALFHNIWDYCIVEDVHEKNDYLFGSSKNGYNFYCMNFDTIIPEELTKSPLWKALE